MEKLKDEVKAVLAKYSKHFVNKDVESLAELFTDDVISLPINGRSKPTFNKNDLKAIYEVLFRTHNYVRQEIAVDEVGEVDGMIYAWGQGSEWNTTNTDTEPVTSIRYERVFKRLGDDKDGDLRIYIQAAHVTSQNTVCTNK